MFDRGVEIKTPEQVDVMRRAGLVVASTLELLASTARAGMTTGELDAIAHDHIRSQGATSNFLGYHGFTGVICTSVNEEVVHGIPGSRVLADGDLLSIDCGAVVEGWHGDAAVTVGIGEVPDELTRLVQVTEDALWAGIAAARPGGRVGDISAAVEASIRAAGDYGIVEGYTGHGIGTAMHLPPDVPNVRGFGRGPRLTPGIALAVEPMVSLGSASTYTLSDDWTVVTDDGSWAAHVEHTFAMTPDGPWVLTAADGGEERLTAAGVRHGGR